MDPTLLHVVCDNTECFWHDQVRSVRMLYVATGVFAKVPLMCECGHDLRHTQAPEPVSAALAQEYEWALMEPPC